MFSAQHLLDILQSLPPCRSYQVAFSGGLDSTVLLHACLEIRTRINASVCAIHVHHGLHPDADQWSSHCAEICAEWGVKLVVERIHIAAKSSLEDRARRLRYRVLGQRNGPCEAVLSAQHADDQVETLFLQLMRGAGVEGLASMPLLGGLGRGRLIRPLLGFRRDALRSYAQRHALRWIEDSSNVNLRFDRNYLRHKVMPRIYHRWPSATQTVGRSARWAAESAAILHEVAAQDIQAYVQNQTLQMACLRHLSERRAANALRFWIKSCGFRVPNENRMRTILHQALVAGLDRIPVIHWQGAQIYRYRDTLYLEKPLPAAPRRSLSWSPEKTLEIPSLGLRLTTQRRLGCGLQQRVRESGLRVRFRGGGERIRLGGQHKDLKKLFQQAGIPPWRRALIPLFYADRHLAAVGNLWISDEFAVTRADCTGLLIHIQNSAQSGDMEFWPETD